MDSSPNTAAAPTAPTAPALGSHPVDGLLRKLARSLPPTENGPAAAGPMLPQAVAAAGGQDLVNLTAAMLNVLRHQGTVLGPASDHRLADVWTAAVCHRVALSLKQAFTSRDRTGEVWSRFVTAWERAHLELTGYFQTHPRSADVSR